MKINAIPKPKPETKAEKKARKAAKHKLTKGYQNKEIKKLEKECDKLWSLKVREGCRCELCGATGDIKSFDAHHLIHRANKMTRWSLENGTCLCKGCHRYKVHMDTMTTAILFEKLKEKRGQAWFEELDCRRFQIFKTDLNWLEKKLKELLCQN
jgi:hypothetical protein